MAQLLVLSPSTRAERGFMSDRYRQQFLYTLSGPHRWRDRRPLGSGSSRRACGESPALRSALIDFLEQVRYKSTAVRRHSSRLGSPNWSKAITFSMRSFSKADLELALG